MKALTLNGHVHNRGIKVICILYSNWLLEIGTCISFKVNAIIVYGLVDDH